MKGSIVICMALHNNASSVSKAIESFLSQKDCKRDTILLVSDDCSSDNSIEIVKSYATDNRIILIENNFYNVSKNRNALVNYVKSSIKNCCIIGRLDADDILYNKTVLSSIEDIFEATNFDVLICGNLQSRDEIILDWENRPDFSLMNEGMLLERLKEMSAGNPKAELPSCNTFYKPDVFIEYPDIPSAEDHWQLVSYLLKKNQINIHIEHELIYSIYSLNGSQTDNNLRKGIFMDSRKKLYEYAQNEIKDRKRIEIAKEILNSYSKGPFYYLGNGFSGVVFHNRKTVFKLHIPISENNYNEIDNIIYLQSKIKAFRGFKHFYNLKKLELYEGTYILTYPFEASEKVNQITREEMVSFLAEMHELKIIFKSITKENNFIRVKGILKLIDYEIEPYTDNLFLNVIARAFIQLQDYSGELINYDKLKRSLINNFNLPELDGLYDFTREVFLSISQRQFKPLLRNNKTESNIVNKTFYDGLNNPKVSLLIKACIQDSENIYRSVVHIIRQLPQIVVFEKKYLLLDQYKDKHFLREYYSSGSQSKLYSEAKRLVDEGYIEEIILPPESSEEIEKINKNWFGLKCRQTHTFNKIPVVSQLFAFDYIKSEYFLQMDCDVLIGKIDDTHDFLKEPIQIFMDQPKVSTIGFQIYQGSEMQFQPYFGYDVALAPDVRCSFIHKTRLLSQKPLLNTLHDDKLNLSWYRALEKSQQMNSFRSIRGGDCRTFYIHPENYRKTNQKLWHYIVSSVEQNNLPKTQIGKENVSGSFFEWSLPKRNEQIVLIITLTEHDNLTWDKMIQSVLSQNFKDFGVIIINNGCDQSCREWLHNLYSCYRNITIMNTEHRLPMNEVIYDAIHYYMENKSSFVCLLKESDILIGEFLLSEIFNRLTLYKADVLIGKELSKKYFSSAGISRVNFIDPRASDSCIDNGLQVFTKELFDELTFYDLKIESKNLKKIYGFKKLSEGYEFLDDNDHFSILAPIIELASNPIRYDFFNVIRSSSFDLINQERISKYIQTRPRKKQGNINKGRKRFETNLFRIEIDITYDCNLKCINCNRSCTQAPGKDHMSLEQIRSFVSESKILNIKWDQINILGGEPTLHPSFHNIIHIILKDYIESFSPETILQVVSNGYGNFVQNQLKILPEHQNLIIDKNSYKFSNKTSYFSPFNIAPVDIAQFTDQDYSNGCWVTSYCGVGLNNIGYFPCSVAGGIERIFKLGHSTNELSMIKNNMSFVLSKYCRFCGNFLDYHKNRGDFMERAEKDSLQQEIMSETWVKKYKEYNEEQ